MPHHRLAGIFSRLEKREIAEIVERKCIAPWHDAVSIASDADPSKLNINGPLQSRRTMAALWFSKLFHPLSLFCHELPEPDVANLPHGRSRPVLPSSRAPAFGRQPKRGRRPISSMRQSEARSVCRGKTASPQTIHVAWDCAILSRSVAAARARENRRQQPRAACAVHQALELSCL